MWETGDESRDRGHGAMGKIMAWETGDRWLREGLGLSRTTRISLQIKCEVGQKEMLRMIARFLARTSWKDGAGEACGGGGCLGV